MEAARSRSRTGPPECRRPRDPLLGGLGSEVRRVTFFEQPVAADDVAGMAAVAAAADCAIGADESIHSLGDIRRHHDGKAACGVSLKTIKLGGMRGVISAGKLCDELGMAVNVACKTGESSIACAAGVHIAAALPQISWALSLTNGGLAEDVTARPVRGERGHVEVSDRPDSRLPEPLEVAAFYVVAEALTNVAKYAQASSASIGVRRAGTEVVIEIADDGVGGADPSGGSGLRGLADRVEALGGKLEFESPAGAGTRIRAVIPLAADSD